jgi:hypothetical protein
MGKLFFTNSLILQRLGNSSEFPKRFFFDLFTHFKVDNQ